MFEVKETLLEKQQKKLLKQLLGPFEKGKVLNLGFGRGVLLELANFGTEVNEEWFSEMFYRYPDKELEAVPPDITNYPSTSFDAIFCMEAMLEKNDDKMKGVLKEASRLLRPNGHLIFSFPTAKRFGKKGYAVNEVKVFFSEKEWDYLANYGLRFLPEIKPPSFLTSFYSSMDDWCRKFMAVDYSYFVVLVYRKEDYVFYGKK